MRKPPMPSTFKSGQRFCKPLSNKLASKSPDVSPATIARCGLYGATTKPAWGANTAGDVGAPAIEKSAHDTALRRGSGQEIKHHGHVGFGLGMALRQAGNALFGLFKRQLITVERALHAFNGGNSLR